MTPDERARAAAIPAALWEPMARSAVLYAACSVFVRDGDAQSAFAAGHRALARHCQESARLAASDGHPVEVGELPPWPATADPDAPLSAEQVEALVAVCARSEALMAKAIRAAELREPPRWVFRLEAERNE